MEKNTSTPYEEEKQDFLPGSNQQKASMKKTNSKVIKKNIEFNGKVLEIHSGDSLTIQSTKKGGSIARFNFTNVRAPIIQRTSMKPWAFEAKEFLRKLLIGKEVLVKMEYEKTIQVQRTEWDNAADDYKEITEDKQLIFAQIYFEEKNVAVQLLENGLANVQKPFNDDEKSVVYDELKAAEELAEQNKVGLYSTKAYSFPKYNDVSNSKNIKQNQWTLEHLKEAGKMHGVVELVLSGGKFKIRIQDQSVYIMFIIAGIRCLPNDENIPGYDEWSNKALKYAKEHLMQRDVTLTVTSMDKKGVYHGSIVYKKQDFGETLLSEGLAIVFGDKNPAYEAVENQAREQKIGLWKANLKLDSVSGNKSKNIQYVNKTLQAQISEVVDFDEFYIQEPVNKVLRDIEKQMGTFDPSKYTTLQNPIKRGTPCVAMFSQDGQYYRAIIKNQVQNKKDIYLVHFIDYGNYDEVHFNDIRKSPEALTKIPPQAIKCNLAYVVGPAKKSPVFSDAIEKFMSLAWEKKIVAQIVYTEADINYVIINTSDQPGADKSVNSQLLRKGFVKLDPAVKLPENLSVFQDQQDYAQDRQYGAWKYEEED